MIKTKGSIPVGYHRTTIVPGTDPMNVLKIVNNDLSSLGMDMIPPAAWEPVKLQCSIVQTLAAIAAYEAMIASATLPLNPKPPPAVFNATNNPLPVADNTTKGARAFVDDALAPVAGKPYVSGGTIASPVYSDGVNWLIG